MSPPRLAADKREDKARRGGGQGKNFINDFFLPSKARRAYKEGGRWCPYAWEEEMEAESGGRRGGRKPIEGAQVGVKLPQWVIEALDAEIAAGRYACRAEAVRRIVIEALVGKGEAKP